MGYHLYVVCFVGVQVNGHNVTFDNCDASPNSYHALFPNFAERSPTSYGLPARHGYQFCDDMFAATASNPSGRAMPADYFMFLETHWGGCGCYSQTDARPSIGSVLGVAVGFR